MSSDAPAQASETGGGLDKKQIFSIGHSTHKSEEFIALLEEAGVGLLVDVRRHPGSRRLPWTSSERLGKLLSDNSITYTHLPDLGGRRRASKRSVNDGWRNVQFRGYADHMLSREFATALARLEAKANHQPAAMMCAEALWWRCHRRMVSDALLVRGWRVVHIGSRGEQDEHLLTSFAVADGERLAYPAPGAANVRATVGESRESE